MAAVESKNLGMLGKGELSSGSGKDFTEEPEDENDVSLKDEWWTVNLLESGVMRLERDTVLINCEGDLGYYFKELCYLGMWRRGMWF